MQESATTKKPVVLTLKKRRKVMEDARNDGENYLDFDSLSPDINKSQKRLRGEGDCDEGDDDDDAVAVGDL
uniref:Uncharacterized protein n=1 Tax=Tanacetum cinerariifolium TaxID=118510 RepID=A0A699GH84_TANCI|nr:hypothetical protein [Tanacetum cinerariifolium]